jgi:hypothetical protein
MATMTDRNRDMPNAGARKPLMETPGDGRQPKGRQLVLTPDRGASGARALSGGLAVRVCEGCGSEFHPTRPNQVSCRPSCRARASRQKRVHKYLELRAGLDAMFGVTRDEP